MCRYFLLLSATTCGGIGGVVQELLVEVTSSQDEGQSRERGNPQKADDAHTSKDAVPVLAVGLGEATTIDNRHGVAGVPAITTGGLMCALLDVNALLLYIYRFGLLSHW